MLVIVAAVLFPLAASMRKKDSLDVDVMRMRKLYMTLAIYESENAGSMPATLEQARYLMPETVMLQSTKDPYVGSADRYPVDGGLPDFKVDAPERISFTYVYAYSAAGKNSTIPWEEYKYLNLNGFLANEWQGEVTREGSFKAKVSGKLIRLNTDGALRIEERAATNEIGDFKSLFAKADPTKCQG